MTVDEHRDALNGGPAAGGTATGGATTGGPVGGEPPSAVQVARRRWRASRAVLLTVPALILLAIIIAALQPTVEPQYLDPESPGQSGTRALVQILGQHGVQVTVSRDAPDAVAKMQSTPDSTLVVVRSERLTPEQLDTLRDAPGDLLLIEPGNVALERLVPGVRPATETFEDMVAPGCRLPAATLAGEVAFGGSRTYEAPESAARCYATEGATEGASERLPRLVQLPVDGRTVTVLGSGRPLTNASLADQGNAALGMNLAGARSSVVWLMPDFPEGGGSGEKSFTDLVPFGVKLAALQLLIGVGLVALWRSRRLGPVVQEPLPVIVRSAETVEGRARLYRAQRARDRAADALRAGARERLVPLLGLPRSAASDPVFAQEIVIALAQRTPWDEAVIGSALYGPAPADDAELVRLSDYLDDLERQVRES